MKKILFITIRNPFSGKFSGDVIRSEKFIQFLSKKNYVDVISIDENTDEVLTVRLVSDPNDCGESAPGSKNPIQSALKYFTDFTPTLL